MSTLSIHRVAGTLMAVCCVVATCTGCTVRTDEQRIRSVIDQQQRAWNRGDIDDFMEHYVKSEELTFSSGGDTTRGWQATLDRYRRRYPDRETMGELSFSDLEITLLNRDAALVLGRWHLDRAADDVGGNFSLVFRKQNHRWRILHDHTSVSPATQSDSSGS